MARQTNKSRAAKKKTAVKKRPGFAYPMVVFLLLCAGVYLIAATFHANAADLRVTAKVAGPPVTSQAVITSPADGDRFKSIPIDITGTCPANAAYVEIFRNDLMSGTAICSISGDFQLSTDLFPGSNELVAHVFNISDDEGPLSDPVTVYYDAPQPPASTPVPAAGSGNSNSQGSSPEKIIPLALKTGFLYKGYYVGQEIDWPMEITGGTAPYAVNVDWGDGQTSLVSLSKAGQFKITHTYDKAGGYKGSYPVVVKAVDANNNSAYLQFFIIINSQQGAVTAGNIFNKPTPTLGHGLNWLWVVWPAYGIITVMVFSYWLGEKEELLILRRKNLIKRRA